MVFPLSSGSLVIDPESRTITYRDDPAAQRLWMWARQNRVEAVERFGDDGTAIVAWKGRIDVRIRRAAWKTLDSGVKDRAEFFPSPNRRFVAVRFLTQDADRRLGRRGRPRVRCGVSAPGAMFTYS